MGCTYVNVDLCSHMYVSFHIHTPLFTYMHLYSNTHVSFHILSLFTPTRLCSHTHVCFHIHTSLFAYKYLFSQMTFLSAYVRYLSALPYPTLNVSDPILFSLLYTFYFPTYTHLFSNIHVSFHICAVPECVPRLQHTTLQHTY